MTIITTLYIKVLFEIFESKDDWLMWFDATVLVHRPESSFSLLFSLSFIDSCLVCRISCAIIDLRWCPLCTDVAIGIKPWSKLQNRFWSCVSHRDLDRRSKTDRVDEFLFFFGDGEIADWWKEYTLRIHSYVWWCYHEKSQCFCIAVFIFLDVNGVANM